MNQFKSHFYKFNIHEGTTSDGSNISSTKPNDRNFFNDLVQERSGITTKVPDHWGKIDFNSGLTNYQNPTGRADLISQLKYNTSLSISWLMYEYMIESLSDERIKRIIKICNILKSIDDNTHYLELSGGFEGDEPIIKYLIPKPKNKNRIEYQIELVDKIQSEIPDENFTDFMLKVFRE